MRTPLKSPNSLVLETFHHELSVISGKAIVALELRSNERDLFHGKSWGISQTDRAFKVPERNFFWTFSEKRLLKLKG